MTDEPKNPQQAKIRSGAPKRNPKSYKLVRDIVIPAGTILRDAGDDEVSCPIGVSPSCTAMFSVEYCSQSLDSGYFIPVIAV